METNTPDDSIANCNEISSNEIDMTVCTMNNDKIWWTICMERSQLSKANQIVSSANICTFLIMLVINLPDSIVCFLFVKLIFQYLKKLHRILLI